MVFLHRHYIENVVFDWMYYIRREGRVSPPPPGLVGLSAVRLQDHALIGPHRIKGNGKKGREGLFGKGWEGRESSARGVRSTPWAGWHHLQ